ncbi:MAG: D-alanyl-D-alanine carboxypeptidase, partial [Fimbriimonadales bacterium]|nr:D-alanyl-D-alanine carboxypeptidase [Fimbriimonadales bacterium]
AWREGDTVYLWGGGDPGLSVQDLQVLAEVLPVHPTDKVVFDDSLFGQASRPPTWESRDFPYGYAAPIRSLTVEGGKAELWVEGARAYLAPRNFGLQVVTRVRKGSLEITVRDPSGGWSAGVAEVSLSPEPKKVATLSLPDPALSAGMVLHRRAKRGVASDPPGEFLFLPAPPGISLSVDKRGRTVVGLRRRSVSQLLKTMLEESDNVYAETLLRLTALKVGGAKSWEEALREFSRYLRSVGVPQRAFVLADGSGLSRSNRLSPRAVVTLLERGITREYSEALVEGLAVPGEGTLKERLMGIPAACKTGTLSGVSCLAGILWQAPPRFF